MTTLKDRPAPVIGGDSGIGFGAAKVPRPGQPAEAAEAYPACTRNSFLTKQTIQIEDGSALAG